MSALIEQEYKGLIIFSAVMLVIFIVLGQTLAWCMATDFKYSLVEHDRAVAGYLARNSLSEARLASAFTTNKTNEDRETGKSLLQAAGYEDTTQINLIPAVQSYYLRNALLMLGLSVVASGILIATLALFARQQDRRIERAIADTRVFLGGNLNVRLDDRGDGSLARLFTTINGMATSLTAYVDKEKRGKQTLRDAIADISHQLKTPLAALRMYNEIIQNERPVNHVVEDFSVKSERELDRMETLIQSLLKLTRLDTGLIELQQSPHNMRLFLEAAVAGFQTRAEKEGKTIKVDCEDRVILSFDDTWLLEAVSNLIKNALDHTETGDKITVLATESPVVTEITITDSGSGIHPEDIHHIFKRFYRSRFSKDQHGIGIGLTLSKAIVEQHGGSMVVESEIGQGSTFHIVFPKLANM